MRRSILVTLFCLFSLAAFTAGPDNRYCKSDDTPTWILWNQAHAYDGPAELPRLCLNTAPWGMPSPGPVIPVAAGDDLLAKYNAAPCGATLALAHGATWNGPFAFPAKGCDNKHWITITSDGLLPAPGMRVGPSNAPQMARFLIKSGYTTFGDHTRVVGIEWAKVPGPLLYGFITMKHANNVVIERNYLHGNAGEELQHGVIVNTGKYIGVIDSYFEEFHCLARIGACVDSQAVSGGSGQDGELISGSGPVKVVNNFLEASGENILFGGGTADGCGPNDIEIRRNHMYKPLSWNPAHPSYAGSEYIVKNLLEFKNGCRALIEGNVLENNWGGYTQRGYAVLLTAKNQSGANGTTLCPNCAVTDITFRYNFISTASGMFTIASTMSDNGGWSLGTHRVSIHDNIADNLQYPTCYLCGTMLFLLGSDYNLTNPPPAAEVLSDILITNVTQIAVGTVAAPGTANAMLNLSGVPPNVSTPQASNITFQNSITSTQQHGMYSTGGGTKNCTYYATKQKPVYLWPTCYVGGAFAGNVLVGYPSPATDWPVGNTLVTDWPSVGLGSDYSLTTDNPFYGKGADGRLVNSYTAGVR